MIDFHLHSTSSDGLDTPSQLIDKAVNLNLKAIALTDHDTILGLEEFISYGEEKNLIVIPGIEVSIRHEPKRDLIDIHIIGLNIDFQSVKFINSIELQIKGRTEQKKAICERLKNELEFDISGVGDIDFNINAERIETTSSGAGDITLTGEVDSQDIDISGVGKYDAEELESRECSISLSGAGSVTVNASEELDISISGVGNVYYVGSPHVEQDISGLGSRIKSID